MEARQDGSDADNITYLWGIDGIEHGLMKHRASGHVVGYVDFLVAGGTRVRLPIPTTSHADALAEVLGRVSKDLAQEAGSSPDEALQ